MPSRKNAQAYDYTPEPYTDNPTDLLDNEPVSRPSRKKKNAKRLESAERASEPETANERSLSPPPVPAIPHRIRPDEELATTEKVSDDHTPPQDTAYTQPIQYGRSPQADLLPGFTHRPSPPAQSYLGGGGFNTRSPPISPPQAKARPVSYGGPPSTVGYQRNSSSPYAYPSSAFGSPPPHMPQAHFYRAQDVDLGLGQRYADNQPPTFVNFTKLGSKSTVLVGTSNRLDVLGYNGDKVQRQGCLSDLPGVVHDAALLTWQRGPDPFKSLRPLIALTIHGQNNSDVVQDEQFINEPLRRASVVSQRPDVAAGLSTTVQIYSLKQQTLLTTLLHIPSLSAPQIPTWMDRQTNQSPVGRLGLLASGNHLIVSSGVSGEVYVFSIKAVNNEPHFICVDKLWTTLQPRIKRRDSSHTRPGEAGISPADLNSSHDNEEQPILAINGRWLSYCPVFASRPSLGAQLGENVLCSSTPSITSRSAPARPATTCAVDSPDVETVLSRVAKGVAQEVLKGGKWLGEKSAQAWQSYWAQDNMTKPSPTSSPIYSPQQRPTFPPTHGESAESPSKEPEVVSIIDLTVLDNRDSRRHHGGPSVTFQPPGGCSYLSFAPNGLTLLTASRRGDIYYVWDLFQARYPRRSLSKDDSGSSAKVRQITRNQRFSESVIVDMQWEAPYGNRYAVLTQNRTVHMFDIPASALRWPPPRARKKPRPVSVPVETTHTSTQQATGFFTSAMNFANSRAQPMLANLRGRAPSMGGGATGFGSTGLGLASATGVRGGKAVAAGLSKSLGAATDTVANIRHAGQSKLHLKSEAIPGRLAWTYRDHRSRLSILELQEIKNYYVRKTNPRDRQPETVSVFDSRKVVNVRLSSGLAISEEDVATAGFWHDEPQRRPSRTSPAPLSFAEIDTNAPYQPFHSDHRVTISVYTDEIPASELPTASAIFDGASSARHPSSKAPATEWLFGQPIPTTRLSNTSPAYDEDRDQLGQCSVVYRETTLQPAEAAGEADQIVSTTRRRKGGKKGRNLPDGLAGLSVGDGGAGVGDAVDEDEDDGFFEDDCDVLDFAEDRV